MKKMRRLIPAIAMLLVSAVMLSTASFAWFTMNDEVTATGMQLQAKSTGSLVIDDAPLQYNSVTTTVDLGVSTAASIKPITWNTDAWKLANGTVDPITGIVTPADGEEALEAVGTDLATTEYFVDKQIYIGSAGDALTTQKLTLNLSTIAGMDEKIYRAYSVAVYIFNPTDAGWTDGVYPSLTAEPVHVLHADSNDDRNVITLDNETAGYTIPSIVGVEGDNKTGLKIVLRFFVDGNLDAIEADGTKSTKTKQVVSYVAADGPYDANTTYYVDAAGTEIGNPQNLTEAMKSDMEASGWYVRSVTETPVEYKIVNSEVVPTTGTSLEFAVSSAKIGG